MRAGKCASVRFLGVCPVFVTILFSSVFVVYCSSVWSFGSHFSFAGVNSLRVSPKCTSHIISQIFFWVTSSSERTKTNYENEITPTHFFTSYLNIVAGCEKQGNASVRFLGVCPVFVTMLFLRVCLLCIVPQYGRLAAICRLLALNHSACL